MTWFWSMAYGMPLTRRDTSDLNLYFSQQTALDPCTGSVVFFDFGMLQMSMDRQPSVLHGTVYLQATLRNEGVSYLQKYNGMFSVPLTAQMTTYDAFLRYKVPQSSMVSLYKIRYDLSSDRVVAATLEDIQLEGNCK
jgi:hypothetical protein